MASTRVTEIVRNSLLIIILVFVKEVTGNSQTDSLIFKNNDALAGEIKSLIKGVVLFKTDYSDSDFKIEWNEVSKICTESYLFVSLSNGENHYGRIKTESDTLVAITSRDNTVVKCRMQDIVHILPIKQGFKDRFSANVDLGLSFTKANNLYQLSLDSKVGYKTEKWTSYITTSTLRSKQDLADPIRRTESDFVFQYVIHKNLYLVPSTKYLANTEQNLKSRWNEQFGVGYYFTRTNSAYWGILIGINLNLEKYTNDTPANTSWEGYFGTELDLFDIDNIKLFMRILAYPGITEKGRWRYDGNLNIKYDLPLDFYIKLGGSINFDNSQAETGSKTDFVIQTGLGWEW